MIIDTKKLQKAVIENKKKHNFNTTDVKFELLLLYGEVNELFQAWLKEDQENINEELGGKKKSEVPSNEEIANAVKTLAKVGFNPMAGFNGNMYSNPEMMQMNMLLGNNGNGAQMNNMLPFLLMSQNQDGTQKMSPELIQSMMMSQMQMY